MNIMRKFLGGAGGQGPGPGGGAGGGRGEVYHPEQELLGLNHLKKMYSEYCSPQLASGEREARLYAMLPLFCKIFNSVPAHVITEKFSEAISFTQACSKLLVTEVRRRASNQSTEQAASAIAQFLEVSPSETDSAGWMLISTVNLLAAETVSLVEVMTTCSVPSTLVKCLYLFFDLPPTQGEVDDTTEVVADPDTEFTDRERRILLQKMLMQVLLRLCTQRAAVEELARKDDLNLLFSAVSSVCPRHNNIWRKTSSDVLLTISRHSLSQPVISYLHNKGCMSMCIENMQRGAGTEIAPLEIVEMFVTIFCFLKDSSSVSQTLLDDFRTCQGYIFLSEFLLKLEQDTDPESSEAIRNLVLLVASLSFCGHTDLPSPPVLANSSLYQLQDFEMPLPENRGSTVRNLQAFQVLQSVFLKCHSASLGGTILDAISTIYHGDNANYFLLQNQHTLSQAAEKISQKPHSVQEKFFQLIEFLVHHIHHIPTKELIAISLLLKSKKNLECCVLAVQSLISILKFDNIFKDVFREVGMVEVLVCLMSLYIDYLGAGVSGKSTQSVYQPSMVPLGEMVIIALTELLSGSIQNAGVFRELGGAKLAGHLVTHQDTRDPGLGLLQQLVVASGPGGDDDMTSLLDLLHSCRPSDLSLKTDILKCLIGCLKESHRCRTVFRRIGGFVYIMSVLVGLESSLDDVPEGNSDWPWANVERRAVFSLLHQIFSSFAVAMRYEPANAKFFHEEIAMSSLGEAIRLLGCFSNHDSLKSITKKPDQELMESFQATFTSELPESAKVLTVPHKIESCCIILRLLHDLSIDKYRQRQRHSSTPARVLDSQSSVTESLPSTPGTPGHKKKLPPLNLNQGKTYDPILVHSGVLVTILKLLPSMYHDQHHDVSASFQLFAAETIKSVLRIEKNQQLMCDVEFMSEILASCKIALEDEAHILHTPFQYLLERLAAQKLQSNDLREFLRLGHPLASLSDDQFENMNKEAPANQKNVGGFVPLTRVKTLVSMTTPKDLHIQNNSILPPFIEFDMNTEGFGCLYIPSLSPQSSHTASVVGVNSLASHESAVVGGVGVGDRVFPPSLGLTFSTWICVDKFSDPRSDPHPVRILTLARNSKSSPDTNYVCLAIAISTRDKAIIVSSQESAMDQNNDWQPEFSGEWGARVWFPDIMKEGEWHHLVFVFSKQVIKNSSFTLYINGQQVASSKMQYISQNPGGAVLHGNTTQSVYGWIGTPPSWRRTSKLSWKQGPCFLFEDVASAAMANLIFRLGPHYLGSLQAPQVSNTGDILTSQISEEKMIIGLNSVATTEMTLSKIRKVYSKVDNKSIAKQLGMTTHENATPIKVIHNSAGHLLGPARSLGGVVIGYLGVRVFNPQPVSKVIQTVGGCNILLGLIAMARDQESLYAGVKALVCVLKSNPFSRSEMENISGYQVLAMLLRKKSTFLNSHILHLIFTLVGTIDSNKEISGIPNLPAFRDLLCDLELWHQAPPEVEKSLFEHFFELISDSGLQRSSSNIKTLREYHLVEKLLVILKKSESSSSTTLTLLNVLHALLCSSPRVTDVLCFVQFTAATLLTSVEDEKSVQLVPGSDGTECSNSGTGLTQEESMIILRNRCLKLFFSLLYTGKKINQKYCEEIINIVGFDWVQLFLLPRLHQTTIIWALRITMTLLSISSLLAKFREGTSNGGWLMKSELVLQNKMGAALGQVSSANKIKQMKIRQDIFIIPGFQMFNWLMPKHIAIPEVYFLLLAMVLGQPVKTLPERVKLDLDSIYNYIFGKSSSEVLNSDLVSRVTLCGEAVCALLCMVRTMLNNETKNPEKLPDWLAEYPVTLTQFLFYLYHNVHEFMPVFMSSSVLTAMAGTLFPTVTPPTPVTSPPNSPLRQSASSPVRPEFLHLASLDDSLTNHPAKRNVMNFLKVLVMDSLSLATSPKQPPVIDALLDAQPDASSLAQQNRFQTDLLTLIMDHLVAADILIGEQAALPIVPGGSANHIAPNVFYLAGRLVDKLWQAVFKKNADEVFQFILKLISQAKRRSGTSMLSLEGIFRCLNRTILYMLSRPIQGVADQTAIMEVLHKLMTNRNIIFGRDNPEIEFFGCLTFCLLQLTSGHVIPIDGGNSKTMWHVSPTDGDLQDVNDVNQHQGQNLLKTSASRVWEEMYFNKKSAIEEVSKVYFPYSNKTPTLESARVLLHEPLSKIWAQYVDMEKKACYQRIPAWEIHTHIQSKLQIGLTGLKGGLKRLTSVSGTSKAKKEEEKKIEMSQLPYSEVEAATINHITIVSEVVEQHGTQRQQTENHLLKFSEEEWLVTEGQLTRERGLWGPESESHLLKWQLDNTEGPSRMRKRLYRDEMFYYRYPYRSDAEGSDKPHKYKKPTSHDSKLWFEKHHTLSLFEREEKALELEYDDCDIAVQEQTNSLSIDEQIREIGFKGLRSAPIDIDEEEEEEEEEKTELESDDKKDSSETPGDGLSVSGEQQNPDAIEEFSSAYQTVMRLMENGEKIVSMYRTARIQGLDIIEGLLLFGKDHFYVIDGFTIVNQREVHDIDFIPANQYDPIIPTVPGQVPKIKPKRQVSKFSFDEVKEVHKRRYLLQPIAVEVFTTNGQNYLLSFQKQYRNKVYQKFSLMATNILENAALSVSGQGRSANVEQASGLFSSLIGETSVTQRWVRGEISNFQYLMSLNTLAGRSYNDLMQYPVFPWVLADYDSEELDLSNPKTFRDLSKPMGAQTEPRLEQFQKRYRDWDDAGTDSPPYHYGTHYSSAMIVSSYLVRLEPFTQHFLHLQGGHFDLADRMFHSIKEAWESSSRNNMADVRELIPEFFYLPDFLTNRNNFDLGTKQSGEPLNFVQLPAWAKNDPREFIRVHREALESDLVSANLHKWIDLIFGYRQHGEAATESSNVFHHLFYEGNVDIFSIDDPMQRNATIGFINNFGQIPKQLFKKAHPAKKISSRSGTGVEVSGSPLNSKIFFHNLTNLRPSMAPVKEVKGPVGEIQQTDRVIYAVEQHKVLVPGNCNRYLAWGFADQSFRLCAYDTDKAVFICEPNYLVGEVLTCVCPNPKLVITAGTSSVVCVWVYQKKLKQLHLQHSLYGHTDAVTCLAANTSWGIAVSGSRDQTAIIWDLSRLTYIKNLPGHAGPVAAVNINELTGDIVSCAGSWLYLWDVNGNSLARVNTAPPPGRDKVTSQILCVAQSQCQEWDRQNVILTGSSDGVVRMWSLDYVEVAVDTISDENILDDGAGEVSSLTKLAKKMSVSLSGDCLTSLREVVARQNQTGHSEASIDSSDTEDCEDLETDAPTQLEDQETVDGCPPLPVDTNNINPGSPVKTPPEICVTADDSFVVVDSPDTEPVMRPGDGYTWSRQLVFRAKLTMHTAFERRDNTEPAAVTSLAVSKDHRTLFVGDDRGRVFSWGVGNKPGKGFVDHWVRDETTDCCQDCKVRFTIYERRHHCRNCGRLFCSACSRYQAEIPKLKIHQQVRVCRQCYNALQAG